MANKKGPRVEIKNGRPIWIETISREKLRSIKTTDPEGVEELHRYLNVYNMSGTSEQRRATEKYLERWNVEAGTGRYEQEMKNLRDNGIGKQALMAQGRRVARDTELNEVLEGNIGREVVYLNEGDNPCEGCEPHGGKEGVYTDFVEDGIMPGVVCLGGDNCLCIFQPI